MEKQINSNKTSHLSQAFPLPLKRLKLSQYLRTIPELTKQITPSFRSNLFFILAPKIV